ncbi:MULTISPECIES: ATP-binding protein [unclassified Halomonas]|uniref:ATP-binding protein n=1 Tax=unclassified Halomonas TaxID=2609666 RepID=UPI0020768D1F|nr:MULTISPECIES: ATP-binding protein [unclassified Halomonas]
MRSIRRYLIRTLALTIIAAISLAALAAYLITDHELEEILDTQLSIHSRLVAGQLSRQPTQDDLLQLAAYMSLPGDPALVYRNGQPLPPAAPNNRDGVPARLYHEEERKLVLGFWDRQRAPVLLGGPWNSPGPFPAPQQEGFRWETFDGKRWRVFSMFDARSDRWISMGLRSRFHTALVERITWNNLIPLLLLLPLLLWLMGRIIRRGLAPISTLSAQVKSRGANDLRRLDGAVPDELDELYQSLNGFIDRLEKTLERERRFTADAAHEMRTPLAALRIHLDNAQAGETLSLGKAYTGVERLQRVVEQLLVLARLDQSSSTCPTTIDVYPVVAELVAEMWPLAHARHQTLTLTGLNRLDVMADEINVGILFRNLLDNAIRYTPEGGRIDIVLARKGTSAKLFVRDTGPGLPEALLGKVTERFRRAADQSTTGSGLGLSIVTELAKRQQATLVLENRSPHGLEAQILWAASDTPSSGLSPGHVR